MYFAARHELSKSLRNRLSPQAPAASAKAPYGTPGMRAEHFLVLQYFCPYDRICGTNFVG